MKYNSFRVRNSTMYSKVKKANGSWIMLPIIVLPLVVTKRIKVANELHSKTDGELVGVARGFVLDMTGNANFGAPSPSLASVTSAIDLFEAKIATAFAVATKENVRARNNQREELSNLLSALGNYVEDQANSAGTDPVEIIESAGMRPKPFTNRRRQQWRVTQGPLSGSLKLTAESIKRGTHEWAYTTTPTDESSWVMMPSSKASIVISGLTLASFVSCRHRTVSANGVSNWEGHDPVIVI